MIEKLFKEFYEEMKRWPPEYYFGFAIMITILVWTIIAYYRLRRRSDRENGKGWRKRIYDYPDKTKS